MNTIEQKAKAYDEIIERAKTMLSAGEVMYGKENNASQLITDLIPELKEREDERIRKEMIKYFTAIKSTIPIGSPNHFDRYIAYLEQKEQNSNDVKREWWNKGYLEGRKNAHIPARELGLPSSWDFQKEQKPSRPSNNILEDASKEFRERNQPPIKSISDELVEIIKGEFEGFRRLLKKKGIDYEPQYGYWEGFARLFDSSAREYVKEQKEQKPISSCDIVPYIDDKIAALQDMWRKEKVAFDWDDMHEMIEDVARHFYQKEQKPADKDFPPLEGVDAIKAKYYDEGFKNGFDEGVDSVKPAEWSEIEDIADHLDNLGYTEMADTLRRFRPQKQEWSEEDEKTINDACEHLTRYGDACCHGVYEELGNKVFKVADRLKSLRPHWKPSEEQMRALGDYIDGEEISEYDMEEIVRLYNDLLKLK